MSRDRGYERPIVDVRCGCGEQKAIDVHDKNFESLMTWCHRCQQYTEQWQFPREIALVSEGVSGK